MTLESWSIILGRGEGGYKDGTGDRPRNGAISPILLKRSLLVTRDPLDEEVPSETYLCQVKACVSYGPLGGRPVYLDSNVWFWV